MVGIASQRSANTALGPVVATDGAEVLAMNTFAPARRTLTGFG